MNIKSNKSDAFGMEQFSSVSRKKAEFIWTQRREIKPDCFGMNIGCSQASCRWLIDCTIKLLLTDSKERV